jgi:CRP-like cAMP-binding protein
VFRGGGPPLRAFGNNARVTEMLGFCADLPVRSVPAGAVLISEGSEPGALLVLASGAVTIERDGVPFARIDHPGAVFGEMSWVLDRPATATVRASQPVQVHVMADPEEFLATHPEAAVEVLRMTAARLDGLTQYLVDVKAQFAGLDGHLGMVDQILDALVHHQAAPTRTGSVRDPEC